MAEVANYGMNKKEDKTMRDMMSKNKDKSESTKREVENLKNQLIDIRRDVNAGVVDWANGRKDLAQQELRRAINELDRITKIQLNTEAYNTLK